MNRRILFLGLGSVLVFSAPLLAVESKPVEMLESEKTVSKELAENLKLGELPPARPILKSAAAPEAQGLIERLVKFMSPPVPPQKKQESLSSRLANPDVMLSKAKHLEPEILSPKPVEKTPVYPETEVSQRKEIYLDRSVESSHRAPQKIRHISENVTIVTKEELEKLPARDLSEALSYIPGVDVSVGSHFGHATAVSIQGSSARHVLVMVDGIPFNQQSSGQANPAKIPIENVERIEIIRGAASSAWGSALGGVINVITKDVGDSKIPKLSQTTSLAEHNTEKFSGQISGAAGPVGYYGFGSYMDSNGIQKYESVDEVKAFGKISSPLTDTLKATGGFGRSEAEVDGSTFGLNSIIPITTFNRMPYLSQYGQALLEWEPNDETHVESAFKFNDQLIRSDSFAVPGGADTFTGRSEFYDDYYGMTLKAVRRFREHDTWVTGYDLNWNLVQSTNLFKGRDIFYHSPYSYYTLNVGPADVQFGGRFDWNNEYGYEFSPSYGGVLNIPGLPETLARLNVSRAFQAPPLIWKYLEANVNGFAVNPDIRPERAWVYELGLETQPIPDIWFKADLYRSDVTDAIAGGRNAQGLQFRRNFEKFRREGIEFETKIKLLRDLTVSGSAAYNHVQDERLNIEVRNNGIPQQTFNLMFDYLHPSGLGVVLLGNYDRSDYVDVLFEPDDRKFILDMKIYKKFARLFRFADVNVFMNVYNLANYKYWSNQFAEAPRRYFEGGVSVDINCHSRESGNPIL